MTQVYNITPLAKRLLIAVPIWVACVSVFVLLIQALFHGGILYAFGLMSLISIPYGIGDILNAALAWAWPLDFAVLFQVIVWLGHHWQDISLSGLMDPRSWIVHIGMAVFVALTVWSRRQIPWRLQMLWSRLR